MNQDDAIRELRERYRTCSPSLDERQRRLWAAAEAIRLGRGGITLVSKALRMSRSTVRRGMRDLAPDSPQTNAGARIRKPGGGRKTRLRRV